MATGLAAHMALECRSRMARRHQYRRDGLAVAYAERGGRGPAAGRGLDGRLFETALTAPCITYGRVDGHMTTAKRLPGGLSGGRSLRTVHAISGGRVWRRQGGCDR